MDKMLFELPEILKDKRISFDIDGVKANTAILAVKLYNKRFNDNKKKSDLIEFNSVMKWITALVNDETKAEREAINIWNHESVLSNAKPVGGAAELSKLLVSQKLNVHYITSRPIYTEEITLNWFGKWFPWVPGGVIHTSTANDGPSSKFKAKLIRDLSIDIHFDDSVKHAEEILKFSPQTKVVLVRQPWNLYIDFRSLPKSIIVPKNSRNKPKLLSAYNALINSEAI